MGKDRSCHSYQNRKNYQNTFLYKLSCCTAFYFISAFSFHVWPQPFQRQGLSLELTKSDKSRLQYTIQNPREAWTQMQMHQFLFENPKAVYLLDNYEKHKDKTELERAYSQVQREDFYETYASTLKDSDEIYAGVDQRIKIRGIGLGTKENASTSKVWNSERLVKNFFSKDYVQTADGSLVNKIDSYSTNLTHDIYECENNTISCRINTDTAFQYLYEVILKKEFADFPKVETRNKGQRQYLSFEEMKLIEPKSAGLIESLFTDQQTLKTVKEIKSVVLEQLSKDNAHIQQNINQFRNKKIERALSMSNDQNPRLVKMEGTLQLLKDAKKELKTQYEKGEINQADWSQKDKIIQQNIENQESSIKLYELHSVMNTSQKWIKSATALAKLVKAPQEIIQLGQAIYAGMDVVKGLGPIWITGAFDPTGMTLAIAGIASLMSIFSESGPNMSQIIWEQMNNIKSNQIRMLKLMYNINFQITGIKEQIRRLENVLNKNHKEIIEAIEGINIEILNVHDKMHTLFVRQGEVANQLLTQNTQNANIANQAAKTFQQRTIDALYNECYTYYHLETQITNDINSNLGEINTCLNSCISEQFNLERSSSCHECSPLESVDCDLNCINRLIQQKLLSRQRYDNCRRDADRELYRIEMHLEGTYNDTKKFDKGTFIVQSGKTPKSLSKTEIQNALDDNEGEARVNTLPIIGNKMRQNARRIANNSNETDDSNETDNSNEIKNALWTDSNLDRYQSLVDQGLLRNPRHLDYNFAIYVETTSRLPLPKTPIGLNEERYQYSMDNLVQMCVDVQRIENISKSSRENIQNALFLFQFAVSQLYNSITKSFNDGINLQLRKHQTKMDKQKEFAKTTLNVNAKECDCDKDYTGYLTNILYGIQNDYSVSEFFDVTLTPNDIVQKASKKHTDTNLRDMGFTRILRFEDQCKKYKKTQKDLKQGHIETPAQLKMLKDTLLEVQNGDQGGCWFTDHYGLITGSKGEKIQLYQPTGIDEFGDPDIEPLCAVFVTDVFERSWFVWEWHEPTKRAICLNTKIEFLYDADFFTEKSKQRLFYATEEDVEKGNFTPVSPLRYMENVIDLTRDDLDEKLKEDINSDLNKIEFVEGFYGDTSLDNSKESRNHYIDALASLITNYYDVRKWEEGSMRIDTVHNRENIGDQEWVNQHMRVKDSYGSCTKYACLKVKNVPIYGVDRKGWRNQATIEMEQERETLKSKISVKPSKIDDLVHLQYNVDTLIKAGYGASQLKTDSKLSDLKKMLETINNLSQGLHTDIVENQLASIENLFHYLPKVVQRLKSDASAEETQPLLPIVSVEHYGFGQPGRRTQALEMIRNRDYFKPRQCLYREQEPVP